jgi:nucleoside-diphosphate-sugar epimerase
MTWLVTGGSGFLGGYILKALADAPYRVIALGRHHPGGWPIERFVRMNLDDVEALNRTIAAIAPDVVIHAAGKTPPASSSALYIANTRNTKHVLDALAATKKACRIVITGSAAELGCVPVDRLPANEDQPCRPTDAYGMSKWAATKMALLAESPLEVMVARLFNPIGPGMPTSQAFGRFAALLAEPGPQTLKISVGDLNARRDFLDIRDAAEALISLAELGRGHSIYHVGTGVSRSIGDGLQELIRLSGREVHVEESIGHRGPSDSRADIQRITGETDWLPRIAWETSLADLWDEASRRLGSRRVA